jgi:signal peptidase I
MFSSHTGELPRPKLKTPGLLLEIVSTVVFVVAVTVLFDLAIPRSLVDGHSMEPTFYGDDRLVVSRVHYLLGQPQRGDILVFNSLRESELERGVMLIKRVIGAPGETVEFRDQKVYINGEALKESYIKDEVCRRRCQDRTWQLAENEYFMMGDNRNNSNDSRSFGPVPLPKIVGRVIFRYYPLSSIGVIPS